MFSFSVKLTYPFNFFDISPLTRCSHDAVPKKNIDKSSTECQVASYFYLRNKIQLPIDWRVAGDCANFYCAKRQASSIDAWNTKLYEIRASIFFCFFSLYGSAYVTLVIAGGFFAECLAICLGQDCIHLLSFILWVIRKFNFVEWVYLFNLWEVHMQLVMCRILLFILFNLMVQNIIDCKNW